MMPAFMNANAPFIISKSVHSSGISAGPELRLNLSTPFVKRAPRSGGAQLWPRIIAARAEIAAPAVAESEAR
jgi:hypothetical protein